MIALFAAASLLAAQPADCSPPAGTDALLAMPQRYIVVGESHGTVETPAAFAQMACAAAEKGPVTIALELPTVMQPQLDAFLAAPDEATAVEALSGTHFLNPRMNDGRSSQAMLAMLLSVRQLRADGRDVAFHAFQPSTPRQRDLTQAWYELDMGHALAGAIYARPQSKVLVLVGNLHARKTGFPRFPDVGVPAAGHLPAADVLTLKVAQQGGTEWNCQSACGTNPSRAVVDIDLRGVRLEPTDDGAYDGVLALGPSTASPPVVPGPGPSLR
ncbi:MULTISPECIES: hypothetical protein [unclassified Brevundimonas]|uniref:hypothetical protein n=1 Tax=unclassified Brevundimonas TaxID=2622653 RepID=UPI000701A1CC|nr:MULTISPECIES: hypothetical protein [unclassified Brevundimonas]KQY82517.1 hypothetical protein ASD25_25295 [Brevundimonas sp. Root1423]KRA26866.1 hypothetical protein ASD59_05895 [Brevundimonas sp. Root608]